MGIRIQRSVDNTASEEVVSLIKHDGLTWSDSPFGLIKNEPNRILVVRV